MLVITRNPKPSGVASTIELAGLPLGVTSTSHEYDNMELLLNRGVVIALCADGIHECRNEHDEEFGYGRVSEYLVAPAGRSAHGIAGAIIDARDTFSIQGALVRDDWTVMILKMTDAIPGSQR